MNDMFLFIRFQKLFASTLTRKWLAHPNVRAYAFPLLCKLQCPLCFLTTVFLQDLPHNLSLCWWRNISSLSSLCMIWMFYRSIRIKQNCHDCSHQRGGILHWISSSSFLFSFADASKGYGIFRHLGRIWCDRFGGAMLIRQCCCGGYQGWKHPWRLQRIQYWSNNCPRRTASAMGDDISCQTFSKNPNLVHDINQNGINTAMLHQHGVGWEQSIVPLNKLQRNWIDEESARRGRGMQQSAMRDAGVR